MKKRISCLLLLSFVLTIFAACGQEKTVQVVTYDKETTEATEPTEPTQEVEELEPIETETTTRSETPEPLYEVSYSSATTHRDSVGNIWLDVMVVCENVSDKPIRLNGGNIIVYANGEEYKNIEDAVCYPQMIETGERCYYFEQYQVDLDESATLTVEASANVELANQMVKYAVEDIQIRDSAFGVEVYGMYQAESDVTGLLCAAVVLFDLEGHPFAVLSDYFDASEKEFILSSDKLPEGLRSTDISSYIAYVYPYGG